MGQNSRKSWLRWILIFFKVSQNSLYLWFFKFDMKIAILKANLQNGHFTNNHEYHILGEFLDISRKSWNWLWLSFSWFSLKNGNLGWKGKIRQFHGIHPKYNVVFNSQYDVDRIINGPTDHWQNGLNQKWNAIDYVTISI